MNGALRNIYLIGMMGVGKSTIGRILANHLKWAFIDVNQMPVSYTHLTLPTKA